MDVHCQGLIAIFLMMAVGHVESQTVSRIAPECYNNETCPCCSVPCPSDRSGICDNNCTDGYHGNKCRNKCPINCISCVDAQQGNGVSNCTLCKDGYFSTAYLYQCQSACSSNCKTCKSSAIQCTSCTGDYYLAASNACLQCNESCKTCSPEGSCTSCKEGFYLHHAQRQCHKCNPLCSSSSAAPNKYHEAIVGITIVSVVIIVGLVGVSVWWNRRRKYGIGSRSNTANTSDIKKVDTELASIGKQTIKLTSRSSNLEAKLEGLKKNIPLQHTDGADKINDTSYEMLQRHNKERPYSSLK